MRKINTDPSDLSDGFCFEQIEEHTKKRDSSFAS